MRALRLLPVIVAVVALSIVVLRVTHPLPDLPAESSAAIPPSESTRLGERLLPMAAGHAGLSGVTPLGDGRDALAMRILLARAAETSIDVQYYIWQTDTTGWLLLDELRAAAERGVRVRLLLDDNGIPGLDDVLASLDAMDNFEVRIFNPFMMRSPKLLSYGFDFFRLNRRMHNKSMTVDGIATVIGGRNIGDIYFAYGDGVAYFDFDVLAVGPAAADVSDNFDTYWTSGSVYAAADVLGPSVRGAEALAEAVAVAQESALGSDYAAAVDNAPIISRLLAGEDILEWTSVTLVSDDPAKGLGLARPEDLVVGQLPSLVGSPQSHADLVSAYLIPGVAGTELLEGFVQEGIRTRIVTNSLEATDVAAVHSAWMGYRNTLVRAGAEVFELKARQDRPDDISLMQILIGSQSSLHAKTFAVDGERIFIGSFNFDPRSAALNTEMGFLIESPTIANELSAAIDRREGFYAVEESAAGEIVWRALSADGVQKTYAVEPNTSVLQRAIVTFLSWLPVEWML
ncbi:phospholipase D family protein [Cognatishimia sp. F0-27]|uniref:phospholipase D family protein n=1 Tax=Cognatishimia sp. F0-27 TaxID=2816855 RepID=UPI001D0C250C|nr:phospholipase D family protein [Cognatishimia sp. F0-27]MCC1493675.1 phospholipase D family protein [Cognatishimia sp. F0-27]